MERVDDCKTTSEASVHATTDWLDILLSIPAYLVWFGPLLIALAWGAWKLVQASHTIDHPAPGAAVQTAHAPAPPAMHPLAHS